MTTSIAPPPDSWSALWGELAQTRRYLAQQIERVHQRPATLSPAPDVNPTPATTTPFQRFCQTFGLSPFEQQILLLCVGLELDQTFAALCAEAQGDAQKPYPTFDLALAALPHPHWSALTPESPLRRWHLIDLGAGHTLTSSPLRVDEWVLHHLAGVPCRDDRLLHLMNPMLTQPDLVPSHHPLATQIVGIWRQGKASLPPLVQLWGQDPISKEAIAATACQQLGWSLHTLSVLALPTQPQDLNQLIRLWEREALLHSSVLFIKGDGIDLHSSAREEALVRLVEQVHSPVILASGDRWTQRQRPLIRLEVHPPTVTEQQALWQQVLGPIAEKLNGTVEILSTEFQLTASTIQTIGTEVVGQLEPSMTSGAPQEDHIKRALRHTCRVQTRPQLDDLAQRIEAIATWNDLVLPEREGTVLHTLAAHVRHRIQVYDRWGFRSRSNRGLGISALFAGVSGTGKTMAAEVLAQDLQLDLYRIDLSSVVSKYIGETEKNLRRIFDAAEASTVILLFDEADALFGKRSDVKDSHDRYANMEVSYLLQRMEAYQGLAILTTNLKDSVDTAFLRRLRFVVKFPFPDLAQRASIWQKVFPAQTPTQDLDVQKLAKLNVAGGNIRNIALNATFLAASRGEPVQMRHLHEAAYSEYMKLERTLTDSEVKGWV